MADVTGKRGKVAPLRRGKVTQENKDESEALKKIWDAKKHGKTQGEFGADYGIGVQSAVGNMLAGKMAISLKAAMGFAKGLNCDVSDFSKRLAAEIAEISEFGPNRWPFPDIDRERFEHLTDIQKGEIQAAVRDRIVLFEEQSRKRNAA